MKKQQLHKRGGTLILMLGLFVVCILLFITMFAMVQRTHKTTVQDYNRQQAYFNAKSVLTSLNQHFMDDTNVLKEIDKQLLSMGMTVQASASMQNTDATATYPVELIFTRSDDKEITVEVSSTVNEITTSLKAVYRKKGGGGSTDSVILDGWIADPANSHAFEYAIYTADALNLSNFTLESDTSGSGGIYTDKKLSLNRTHITGDINSDFLDIRGASEQNAEINGNVYVKRSIKDIYYSYIHGNIVATSPQRSVDSCATSPNINHSIIKGNIYVDAARCGSKQEFKLTNSVLQGNFYNYATITGFYDYTRLNASAILGNWYVEMPRKLFMSSNSFVIGSTNLDVVDSGLSYFYKTTGTLTEAMLLSMRRDAASWINECVRVGTCTPLGAFTPVSASSKPSFPTAPSYEEIEEVLRNPKYVTTEIHPTFTTGGSASKKELVIDATSAPAYIHLKASDLKHYPLRIIGDYAVYIVMDDKKVEINDPIDPDTEYPRVFFLLEEAEELTVTTDVFNGYVYGSDVAMRFIWDGDVMIQGAFNVEHLNMQVKGDTVMTYANPAEGFRDTYQLDRYE